MDTTKTVIKVGNMLIKRISLLVVALVVGIVMVSTLVFAVEGVDAQDPGAGSGSVTSPSNSSISMELPPGPGSDNVEPMCRRCCEYSYRWDCSEWYYDNDCDCIKYICKKIRYCSRWSNWLGQC